MNDKIDFDEYGKQLRCPSGKYANEVAENMYLTNSNMINKTIDTLHIQPLSKILEIGFGNAKHLSGMFEKYQGINYRGVDISEAMVTEATLINTVHIVNNKAIFNLVTGDGALNMESNYFDCCFTVNTIYFWKNVLFQLHEIYQALLTGGMLAVSLFEKRYGEKLPFAKTGFRFYEISEIETFLGEAGFSNIESFKYTELITSSTGKQIVRPFVVVTGQKADAINKN